MIVIFLHSHILRPKKFILKSAFHDKIVSQLNIVNHPRKAHFIVKNYTLGVYYTLDVELYIECRPA